MHRRILQPLFVGCFIETRTLDNYNHIILIILVIMTITLHIVAHPREHFTRRVRKAPVFIHHRVRLDVNLNIHLIVCSLSYHRTVIRVAASSPLSFSIYCLIHGLVEEAPTDHVTA
jgi:hypothetical protein